MGLMRSATAPWNSLTGRGPGRPRKESPEAVRRPGCIWPQPDGPCRARRTPGLALCARHAEVLSQPSHRCLWPGCIQSSYASCCGYHTKIVNLLIDAPRTRSEVL